MTESGPSERYDIGQDAVSTAREQRRLRALAAVSDPGSRASIEACGITAGWRCLELGAGAGTMSAWLADRVGPTGAVMSLDIDLRFHDPMPENVTIEEADIRGAVLPDDHYDLVHARAVLQHLGDEREVVLAALAAATRPGGWLVLEDGDMRAFAEQPLPEPLATVHRTLHEGAVTFTPWWDPHFGTRTPGLCRELGLDVVDVKGTVRALRPEDGSGEWWFAAIEHATPRIIDAGLLTEDQVRAAIAQVREPGFVMLGPVAYSIRVRKPA